MRYPGMLIAIRFLHHKDSGIRFINTGTNHHGRSHEFLTPEKYRVSPYE